MGFDPIAAKSKMHTCQLYIYSRSAGRLIKKLNDARKFLRLNSTGSQFCQGLVIIVDDWEGQLPLNPTKQDLSFANGKPTGMAHEETPRIWLRCAVKLFYEHHLAKYDEKKADLTEAIGKYFRTVKRLCMKPPVVVLAEVNFSDFAETSVYRQMRNGQYTNLLPSKGEIRSTEFPSTIWKLARKKKSKHKPEKKRKM